MKYALTLLIALLLAPPAEQTCAAAPRDIVEQQATTPPGASEPFGVSVTRDGGLRLDGKPLRALGVNYFNAFIRTLKNGDDTSYDAGFEVLAATHISWARFAACGFWPVDMKLYQDDRAEYFRRMDGVVRSAEKHRVGLVPSLFWHMPMVPDLVGEPCGAWGDAASKTHAFMREYTREVVTRYKRSPAIWGWEFGNEYNLAADLAFTGNRPAIAPERGTPPARSERDSLTTPMIHTALVAFADEVRKHDPHRFITSGHSVVRPGAHHLLHAASWGVDTRAQSREMFALQHPPGIDVLSTHLYTFLEKKLWDMERLEQVAADARALGRPLMLGEFQIPEAYADEADTPAIRDAFRSFLRRVDAAGVPLAAVWVFDYPPHDKERCNITRTNKRGWQLDEMGARNIAWTKQAAVGGYAVASRLEEFLGEPLFVPMQELWEKRGGWGGVLTAKDGTVVAFQSPGGGNCRRSRDGGKTWGADILIAPDANNGRGLVDETTGDILYVNPGAGWLFRSRDHGASWTRENVQARPDGLGNIPDPGLGVLAMQCGITLAFGERKGRLLIPARVAGPKHSNAVEWRPYHYSTALYSDDGGRVWQTSKPFPVLGTGEAALAELSDGSILYNSREHMTRGNRFMAHSDDGGDLWLGAYRSPDLPDGVRGTSYGCLGGMVRLPVAGHDILLYSNLDSEAGKMPAQTGGSTREFSEKVTVWASFDGGRTWPVKRLVHDGPSAYSTLAVGRSGTSSQGRIYLLFEGGPHRWDEAVQVAAFNLSWLLDSRDLAPLLGKTSKSPTTP